MRKAIKIIACFLITSIVTLAIVILYPEKLFARHVDYKNVSIYSDKVVEQYSSVIDEAIAIIETSELFDPHYKYDIFLTGQNIYRTIVANAIGPAMAQSLDNNILINAEVDFEQNKIYNVPSKRNLKETIAHEMIHCLQLHKYGMWTFNPIHQPPVWKTEGYPEFIASLRQRQAAGYDFKTMVRKLLDFEEAKMEWVEVTPGFADPIIYFKGRIMVEYLIAVRKMTFDDIMKSKSSEEAIYNELISWYRSR